MTIWETLVGQQHVDRDAAGRGPGRGMTHAWLFTGPPGSGRSNAAVAFAAALQCPRSGCGECPACRSTLAGSNVDVWVHRPERSQIQVAEVRDWVLKAALHADGQPLADPDHRGRRPAQRLLGQRAAQGDRGADPAHGLDPLRAAARRRAARRSGPGPATSIWSPRRPEEVADFLVRRHDVSPARAAHAARASQGHIGRAKALALEEGTRNRRRELVMLPPRLTSLGACMTAAANLVSIAEDEAKAQTERLFAKEIADLETLYGSERRTRSTRSAKAAERDLAEQQKARLRRQVLDAVDGALTELLSVYRDVLVVQTGAGGHLVNEEQRPEVEDLARRTTAEDTLRRIDAVYEARQQMMEFNVPPLLALESMMVSLKTS